MAEEKTFAASLGIEAYTADELGFTLSGEYDAISDDELAKFQAIHENTKNAAAARIAANVTKAQAELGTQISGYEYVDILCASPIKRDLNPPFTTLPTKIVGAGERIFHRAFLLINPLPGPSNTPSGTMVLGSRPLRVQFSLMNVTTVAAPIPPGTWTGTFAGLAPTLVLFYWPVTHADVGPDPQIWELNVTFDCGDPQQPYAAFATRWWDGDTDPGWPRYPAQATLPPGWRVQAPLRYLVFRK